MSLQLHHIVRGALKESRKMAPVGAGKSPLVAFVVGFLFGPIGAGIYLGSFADFAMLLGVILAGAFLTAGFAAPVAWVFSGVWAAHRVNQSNKGRHG